MGLSARYWTREKLAARVEEQRETIAQLRAQVASLKVSLRTARFRARAKVEAEDAIVEQRVRREKIRAVEKAARALGIDVQDVARNRSTGEGEGEA